MQLFAFGLNHKTAPIEIRERVNFSAERLKYALHDFILHDLAQEVVILSTCNRTELYCGMTQDNIQPIIDWLGHYHHVATNQLTAHLYRYNQSAVVRHLFRVAAGLDSMILGEPQILGQIKSAYSIARKEGTLGKRLNKLFEYSFSVSKQVRTDTAIGSSPVSIAFAAVRLAQQIFGDLENYTALLIGAGETIELAARHLHENNLGRMVVANRTLERARQLAKTFSGYAITLEEIVAHLAEVDMIISSTASDHYLLTKQALEQTIKIRKHRPMFIVDIAVPRDVEPTVGELEDIYLYSVDDLNDVIQENLRLRKQAALQAEEIVDTEVMHFMHWWHSLSAVDTICDLRTQANDMRQCVVTKAKRMLQNGKHPEAVVDYIAHTLTNKLLHTPCVQLRQVGQDDRDELILRTRQLFQLAENETKL